MARHNSNRTQTHYRGSAVADDRMTPNPLWREFPLTPMGFSSSTGSSGEFYLYPPLRPELCGYGTERPITPTRCIMTTFAAPDSDGARLLVLDRLGWPERVAGASGAGGRCRGRCTRGNGGWRRRCDRDIQDVLDVSSGACAGKGPDESDAGY